MTGIENSPTYSERRYRLEKETETVDDLLLNLSLFNERDTVASLENQMKESLLQKLQTVSKLLTVRLKEIRELKRAKTYNVKSMIECVGGEAKWRKSKMVNAISRAKCELVQIDNSISSSLQLNKDACLVS